MNVLTSLHEKQHNVGKTQRLTANIYHQRKALSNCKLGCQQQYAILSIRKTIFSAILGLSLFRFLVITSPDLDKWRSLGTDVVGMLSIILVIFTTIGNGGSC
jgi:hypothetical protein